MVVEVPKSIRVGNVGLRMSLVTTIQGRKLDRVPNEEHRQIIENKVSETLVIVQRAT